ncbi:homocysteine S-methyltransferase family protein [Sandaracinus amylolyticus]|uniref:homocysteine S-methyltransferase family protein n=1 Tax=Sandaracinus amylolyticus TaxID=927083 RepID=UPI001F0A61A1|nr:homocysteine S-methyltransferase family protein [Sandaracinus amylolyticus]
MSFLLLDGPVGTELARRGVATPAPMWSASAIDAAPDVLAAVHHDYAQAGATVHTAATFRTTPRASGAAWERLARRAVDIARASIDPAHRVAGSIAPLEDCYRPDRSPSDPRPEHRMLARALASAGVDLLLCETFPHVAEALVAVEEAVATGVPTWLALTAGPDADLLTPAQIAEGAREAVRRGARAVLVDCVPADRTLPYVEAIARLDLGVPLGAYANAGREADGIGWRSNDPERGAQRYLAHARRWIEAGATIVGGCCGTSVAHVAALRAERDR